jgi:ADP-ribose pyrophosphatase YjhB (NUDIX family)
VSLERIRHRRIGAYGVLRDRDDRIALTAVPDRDGGIRWGLPGGILGHGESAEAALCRGAGELLPDPAGRVRLASVRTDVAADSGSVDEVHTVRLFFHAGVPRREPDPSSPDPVRHRFVPEGDLGDVPLLDVAARALGAPSRGLVEDPVPGPGDGPVSGAGPVRVQRVAVYAVVVVARRILLTRLAGDGRWTLPGGGIEFGEQPVVALRREVMEETGLTLVSEQLAGVGNAHVVGRGPTGRLEDFHAVRIYYRGEVAVDVEPVVQEVGGSTDAAAWIPIRDLDRTPVVGMVEEVLAGFDPDPAPGGPA